MAIPKKKSGTIYRVKVDKDSGKVSIEQWMGGEEYKIQDVDFSGKLIGFKLASFEYQKKQKFKIQLKIETLEGVDFIEMGFNFLAKNLTNTLYSVAPGSDVDLSFYTKDKHAKVAVQVNGEKGSWFWSLDQVKKANEKGDADWLKLAEELSKKYKDYRLVDELDTWSEKARELKAEPEPVSVDDDLPF